MNGLRRLLALGLAALLVACGLPLAPATPATPDGKGFLLVADPQAERIYSYRLPELALAGQLEGVKFGVHNGALALADGRILFTDDKSGELLALRFTEDGRPSIAQRVKLSAGGRIVWSSIDPEGKYWVGASQQDKTTFEYANLVDLATFTNTAVEIPMRADEELHPALGGNPLTMTASVGGEVRTYLVRDLLAGRVIPTSTVQVETGSHGAVFSPPLNRFWVTTPKGMNVADLQEGRLRTPSLIAWDVDGLKGGRNARPRLSADGARIYGVLTQPAGSPEQWAEQQVDLHVIDAKDGTPRRFSIGKGVVGSRFGLSRPYLLTFGVHPDGDEAKLIDIDPSSKTLHQIVGRIPLQAMSNGPTKGVPTAGREARSGTMTPDGRLGFVANGGDGRVAVIDTQSMKVSGSISVPTPLKSGGFLFAVQTGVKPADLFLR